MVSLQPRARCPQKLTSVVGALLLFLGVALVPEKAFAENTVTRWAEHAMQAVRAGNVGTPNAGRLYAMVTVAMYDAVNGIDSTRHRGREHALVPPAGAPRGGSRSAAAAAAAHAVLVALVSSQQSVLDLALAGELAAAGDGDVAAGKAWGESVGEQVVLLRSNDGTQAALTMPAGTGIGEHRAAFDARFRNMALFGIRNKAPYVAGPPPPLTSEAYARAFNDVKKFGEQDGDPERNEIALFWLAEANTVRETGTWIQATVAIVEQQGTDKSLSDTARLFARVGMAIADAVTVVWETKAIYFTWRPFFAVREADSDPNPDTVGDVMWTPRNVSIGASPEYNSGTSAFAGAASAVIEAFYWPRRVSFCFSSDGAPNGDRCYASPLAGALEAGRSRIYQGIHFQFANDSGRRAGRRIGAEVALTRLRFCLFGSSLCLP
jgi:hypothetical protein